MTQAAEDPEAAVAAAPDAAELVGVQVGGADYAFLIDEVLEVIRTPPVTPVPFTKSSVRGAFQLRGQIIPALDLGVALGGPLSRGARAVVVHDAAAGNAVGVLVDTVIGTLSLSDGPTESVPAEVISALPADVVAGVLSSGPGRIVTLLNLEAVLALGRADKERA